MAENITKNALHDASPWQHVVFASGGSRAILGGAGALLAFDVLGMSNWKTIGGVSGGSIPALLLATGHDSKAVLRIAIETDFAGKLIPRTGALRRLLALILKYRHEMNLPVRGVFGSKPLGDFIDSRTAQWPEKFWTIASSRQDHALFTAGGVRRFVPGVGATDLIASVPPSPGCAVRATCAVPGFVDAVELYGRHWHDGAIREDGQCPVDVLTDHFGATPDTIVAFDVGEDDIKKSWILRTLWRLGCLGKCGSIYGKHPDGSNGTVVITPRSSGFHALKFTLSSDEKWHSVISGFTAAVAALKGRVPLDGTALARAVMLADNLNRMLDGNGRRGRLTAEAEDFLGAQGLF